MTSRELYYTLVYPYLYYGNIVWGCTYEANLRRLIILQKRVVRFITKSTFDAHTAPNFHKHKLLSLSNIYKLQAELFMFSTHNKLLPEKFQVYIVSQEFSFTFLPSQAGESF